jgi:hypothetical protein
MIQGAEMQRTAVCAALLAALTGCAGGADSANERPVFAPSTGFGAGWNNTLKTVGLPAKPTAQEWEAGRQAARETRDYAPLDWAKCSDMGFKAGTEAFANCLLKLEEIRGRASAR